MWGLLEMSSAQLQTVAQKEAMAFGICTLTAKRLKATICKDEGGTRQDLGESAGLGEDAGDRMATAQQDMAKVTERVLNGPDTGASQISKMDRSELLAFVKKSCLSMRLCQRSLLDMRKKCGKLNEHKKSIKEYGNSGPPADEEHRAPPGMAETVAASAKAHQEQDDHEAKLDAIDNMDEEDEDADQS